MSESTTNQQNYAVFPLGTVLYPGATMRLQIFEPRYLDMVSDCMSQSKPFIISRRLKGNEVGEPATFDPIGTFAHIIDFDQREDGLLLIKVEGAKRVRIRHHDYKENKLAITKEIQILPEVRDASIPEGVEALQELLSKIAKLPEVDIELDPIAINSCQYVVHQLAQVLPLELGFKQYLLEETDPARKCFALFEQLLEGSNSEENDD